MRNDSSQKSVRLLAKVGGHCASGMSMVVDETEYTIQSGTMNGLSLDPGDHVEVMYSDDERLIRVVTHKNGDPERNTSSDTQKFLHTLIKEVVSESSDADLFNASDRNDLVNGIFDTLDHFFFFSAKFPIKE
jgi:hypothetical protein